MRRVVWLVLIALLMPALAGCLGADPAPAETADPLGEETAFGAIDLTVLDPGLVPVPDVQVTLVTADGARSQTTNVLGIARFSEVAPGNVTLRVAIDRYLPAELSFTLQPGQNAAAEVRLEREAPLAFVDEYTFEGFFDCSLTALILTGDCLVLLTYLGIPPPVNATNERFIFDFQVVEGWTLIRVTQTWDEPDFALGSMMRVNLEPYEEEPQVEHTDRYGRAQGESPIVLEVLPGVLHEEASEEDMVLGPAGGHVQTRSFHLGFKDLHDPGGSGFLGAGFAYQQHFTVHVEVHYTEVPI